VPEGQAIALPGAGSPDAAPTSRWRDLGAGLCVAGLLLPEAVAYAGLAHLPVVHALTAMMVGLGIYVDRTGQRIPPLSTEQRTSQRVSIRRSARTG